MDTMLSPDAAEYVENALKSEAALDHALCAIDALDATAEDLVDAADVPLFETEQCNGSKLITPRDVQAKKEIKMLKEPSTFGDASAPNSKCAKG